MGIKSVRINNLLSFDELLIDDFQDINCIIGKNNVGKSNLLKLLSFFYAKLENKRVLPPKLHSNYSSFGSITIVFNTTRINKIVTSKKRNKSPFFKHIYNTLFDQKKIEDAKSFWHFCSLKAPQKVPVHQYELTLTVHSDESISWSNKNKEVRNVLNHLYPFFEIETRHIDLYDWDKLWFLISKLKSFNVNHLKSEEIIKFFDGQISEESNSYGDYIDKIQSITQTSKYSYREKVLNYVKVGLKGHTFMISGQELELQSDGTNSHKYLEIFLELLISLTRREYISPTVYIDEPETGLHPKRNEELISNLYVTYSSFKKKTKEIEIGKYSTPYPIIIFSTHSPNILKYVIRLFKENQQVLHFSKKEDSSTKVSKLNSQYSDSRFLNIFSDNEARLFFSDFILFVEGATELELFGNLNLIRKFPNLNKIDVYQSNDVISKNVNPSYSKAIIPYLILYDADTLVTFNLRSSCYSLEHSKNKIKLEKFRKKYDYFNTETSRQQKYLDTVIKDDKQVSLDLLKIKSTNFNLHTFIAKANKNILRNKNYYLASTTIEGFLINIKSLKLFTDWLKDVIFNELNVKNDHGQGIKIIDRNKKRFDSNAYDILKIMDDLFCNYQNSLGDLDVDKSDFLIKLKTEYYNKLLSEINLLSSTEIDLLITFRLLFSGKTDTLVSMDNKKFKELDQTYQNKLNEIKDKIMVPLAFLQGKTSGWVTSFLDYSITQLEIKHKDNFDVEFKNTFPELYDIIELVSASIEHESRLNK